MPETICYWDFDNAKSMVHSKKAIEAAMFIIFTYYTIFVIISEIKRGTKVSLNFFGFLPTSFNIITHI